jgi:hypothetical protein
MEERLGNPDVRTPRCIRFRFPYLVRSIWAVEVRRFRCRVDFTDNDGALASRGSSHDFLFPYYHVPTWGPPGILSLLIIFVNLTQRQNL